MIERGQWIDRLAAWWLADRYVLVPLDIRTPETIGGFAVAPAAYYEAVPTGQRSAADHPCVCIGKHTLEQLARGEAVVLRGLMQGTITLIHASDFPSDAILAPPLPPGARVRNPPPIPKLGPYVPEKSNGTIREVIAADAERVTFVDGHRGEVTIKLRSWDDWQRANKARLTLPGERSPQQATTTVELCEMEAEQ